ncbi:MAG: hypothetical protein ABMA64_36600 [Myxococcota bacterium]
MRGSWVLVLVFSAVGLATSPAHACGNELVEGSNDLVSLALMAVFGLGAAGVAAGISLVVALAIGWVAWSLVRAPALS